MGFLYYTCISTPIACRNYLIIKQDGSYSAALKKIIQETGLKVDGTLTDLVEKTQKKQGHGGWIREQGKERWELADFSVSDRSLYFDCFGRLGFLDEVKPTRKRYKYALIFGATVQAMRLRFAYLLRLINEDTIEVEYIIFLVGNRIRNDSIETAEVLYNQERSILPFSRQWQKSDILPETETDIARLIVEQTELSDIIQNKISFVDAPVHVNGDGTVSRPRTDSTVLAWLDQKPIQGTVMCISSQPYIDRQLLVIQRLLVGWDIECVGPAIKNDDFNFAVLFDSLARTIWELGSSRK